MKKGTKIYLMTAGTFLPAFTAVAVASAIRKKPVSPVPMCLLIFAAAANVGGYFTAKIIKEIEG